MTIYVILMLLALSGYFLNANKSDSNRKIYLFFVFSALLIVAMFRTEDVGTDLKLFYSQYFPLFKYTPWNDLQSVTASGDWELGFCAFCKITSQISTDPQCFIIFSSIVTIVPCAIFIYKNSEDVVFSTVFYLGYNMYMMSLNVVRQAMAVGIILLGLKALKHKKYLVYVLFVLVATLFHTTAIVALLLLLCNFLTFKKKTFYVLAALTIAIAVGFRTLFNFLITENPLLNVAYDIYSSDSTHASGYITYHTLITFLIALYVFVLGQRRYNRPFRPTRKANFYTPYWEESMLMFAVYFAVLFRFAAFIINVTSRFSLYFIPFLMIAFPHFCYKIPKNQTRQTTTFMMMIVVIAYFLFIGFTRAEGMWETVPYKTDILW